MKITLNLFTLTTAVTLKQSLSVLHCSVQVTGLVTIQWSDVTNKTVGCVVFILRIFNFLYTISLMTNCEFLNWKIVFKMTIIRVIHSIQIRSKSWVEVSWGKPEGLTSVLYRAKKRTCCWMIHWFTTCLCVSVLAAGGSVHFPGLCDGRLPDQLHCKSTTVNTF